VNSILADLIALIHAIYILFVLLGQLLILVGWLASWEWTRNMLFRLCHLAAIGLVVVEAWTGLFCPLTLLENRLRRLAGASSYESSFIGYWVDWLIYYTAPEWVFTLIYSIFAIIVLVTFYVYPPIRSTKHEK